MAAGVPFEVVPGVTSAVAVPAYAGVPVTHRGLATSFTVVTGHSRHAVDRETNWEALAAAGGTIVVLMGVAHRAESPSRLMAGGLPGDTPVVAVHWGTRPDQRTVRTTLGGSGSGRLEPPVTLVDRQRSPAWTWPGSRTRPLFGRRVVVTRAREPGLGAVSSGSGRSAPRPSRCRPIESPIRPTAGQGCARPPRRGSTRTTGWCSPRPTPSTALLAEVPDARRFGALRIAAVGPGTAAALARPGWWPTWSPTRFVAEALLEASSRPAPGPGPAAAGAADARDVLPDGLRPPGWEVDVVDAYRTVPVHPDAEPTGGRRRAPTPSPSPRRRR